MIETAPQPASPIDDCFEMGRLCLCFNLRRATRAVTSLYDEILRTSGLKATQLTLIAAVMTLTAREGAPTMTRLADVLGMDASTLSRNAALLEREGLAALKPARDRRSRVLQVTDEGRRRLELARPLWEKAQATMFDGLGEVDSLEGLKLLRRIARVPYQGQAEF